MNKRDTLVARVTSVPACPDVVDGGHSTRPLRDFLMVLAAYRIELVADVRRFPGSRSQPQYQQTILESTLHGAGSDYIWLPDLGGRRPPVPETPNTGWRHPAFRGYADYMRGEEFAVGRWMPQPLKPIA